MAVSIRGYGEVSLSDLFSDATPGDAAPMQERDPPVAKVVRRPERNPEIVVTAIGQVLGVW